MLKKCPDCHKEIANNAFKCPNCGHIFTRKIEQIIIPIILIIAFAIGLFVYNKDNEERQNRMQNLKKAQEQLNGN